MRIWRGLDFLGRVLIGAGILILFFVTYQLWGTGLIEQKAQNSLENEFEQTIQDTTPTTQPSTTTEPVGPPAPPSGNAVAHIVIPKIGVDKIVVQGVHISDLKKGPGHYPQTPFPGQHGNAAIAGHRTTYGAPFNRLDELNAGDEILVTTKEGSYTYKVSEKKIVKPRQVDVLNNTEDDRLTLTTCHPKYSAAQRLVIIASLSTGEAGPASPPVNEDEEVLPASGEDGQTAEATGPGLSGESAPRAPAIIWGIFAAGVFFAILALARKWNRWLVYIIGAPIFLVVLFFFFENFNRLLPANV